MKRFGLRIFSVLGLLFIAIVFQNCNKEKPPIVPPNTNYTDINNACGFGVLDKVRGIWNGPVTSTTALGGFPMWIVDFRPISENQVSAKNELDTQNDIHMSFFIAKYNNDYRVCFRNGGSFAGQTRVSYFLADSVSETGSQSYYRFAEILKGRTRASTELIFRSDSMIMNSYTNKYNTLNNPVPHMTWSAKLQDNTSSQAATTHFGFPKKTLTKDFSSTFTGLTETIFYSIAGTDPYPENQQPYLGKANISYTYLSGYTPSSSKKVVLAITAQPLISGFTINSANLKFRTRYVVLSATNQAFTFNYMHPGTYYLYAFYDADGNNYYTSGDWVSTTNSTFTLPALGNVNGTTQINYTIP